MGEVISSENTLKMKFVNPTSIVILTKNAAEIAMQFESQIFDKN